MFILISVNKEKQWDFFPVSFWKHDENEFENGVIRE